MNMRLKVSPFFVVILFVIISTCMIRNTLGAEPSIRMNQEQRQLYEGAIVAKVRDVCNDAFLYNSGVMLNKSEQTDTVYRYSLSIHHSLVGRLDRKEIDDLISNIENIVSMDSFGYDFSSEYISEDGTILMGFSSIR